MPRRQQEAALSSSINFGSLKVQHYIGQFADVSPNVLLINRLGLIAQAHRLYSFHCRAQQLQDMLLDM
jgi:hypothetical protein